MKLLVMIFFILITSCGGGGSSGSTSGATIESISGISQLAGTYSLSAFSIYYTDGSTLDSSNLSFSGTMLIESGGTTSQSGTAEGVTFTATGTMQVYDSNTLLVTSGGCQYTLEFLFYSNNMLTTTSSANACDTTTISQIYTWSRTSSSYLLDGEDYDPDLDFPEEGTLFNFDYYTPENR